MSIYYLLGTDIPLSDLRESNSSISLEFEEKVYEKAIINRKYLYEIHYDGSLYYEAYLEKNWDSSKNEYIEILSYIGCKREFKFFVEYIKKQLKKGISQISFILQQETDCPIENINDNVIHSRKIIDLSIYQFHDFEFRFKFNTEYIFILSNINVQCINVNIFNDHYYLLGSDKELTNIINNRELKIIQLNEERKCNPFNKKYLYKILAKKLYYSESGLFNRNIIKKNEEVDFVVVNNRFYFDIFVDYIREQLILGGEINLIIQREMDNLDTFNEYNKINSQEILNLSEDIFNDVEFSFHFNKEYIFIKENSNIDL